MRKRAGSDKSAAAVSRSSRPIPPGVNCSADPMSQMLKRYAAASANRRRRKRENPSDTMRSLKVLKKRANAGACKMRRATGKRVRTITRTLRYHVMSSVVLVGEDEREDEKDGNDGCWL